jgi:pyrroline-5-carboxylate reductase
MDSVLFVGGGSMGSALIKAIRQSHPATLVYLEEKDVAKRDSIVSEFGVKPADADTATKVDLIVLAVKPQDLVNVMENLNPKITSNQTVMSIAAGIKLEKLKNGLGNAGAVIRCMPNTPALIGRGYSQYLYCQIRMKYI